MNWIFNEIAIAFLRLRLTLLLAAANQVTPEIADVAEAMLERRERRPAWLADRRKR